MRRFNRKKLEKNFVIRKLIEAAEAVVSIYVNMHPEQVSNKKFKACYHRDIDWEQPVMFDEKLMVLKCRQYRKNELVIQCCDKYRVQEYVKACGLGSILNEQYGMWKRAKDIPLEELPDRFVVKRNNDAGGVLVVTDKAKEPRLERKLKELESGLSKKHGILWGELQYQYIKPCLVAEKYIGLEDGSFPYDYKVFCMNGRACCTLVCVGREDHDSLLRFMVDREFQLIDIMCEKEKPQKNEEIQSWKPSGYDKMLAAAEKLAAPFPFVRVDLYEVEGKLLFGEMTFTPMSCINDYFTPEGQQLLGSWLQIEDMKEESNKG